MNPFQAIGNFFSNFFSGGNRRKDDDEERKRRQQERQAQQQAKKQDQPQQRVGQQPFTLSQPQQQVRQSNRNQALPTSGIQQLGIDKLNQENQKRIDQNKPKATRPEVLKIQKQVQEKYAKPKVQDVNNYYGSDLKKLQDEVAKGDRADLTRVRGLMQSLDNRRKELTDYQQGGRSRANQNFNQFRKERTTQRQNRQQLKKEQEEAEHKKKVNQFLDSYGDQLETSFGGTINDQIRRYNNASAGEQAEMMRLLQTRASRRLDRGNDRVKRERDEAATLLMALEERGKTSGGATALQFGRNIVDGTVDLFKNVDDAAKASADTIHNRVTGNRRDNTTLARLERAYRNGDLSEREYIKRLNEENNRLDEFTGGALDRGALDRFLRSAGTGVDMAGTIVPLGSAYRGATMASRGAKALEAAKYIGKESGLNAAFGAGGALRSGTDTTAQDVFNEAAISAALGAGLSGAGLTLGGVHRTLANRNLPPTPEQTQNLLSGTNTPEVPVTPSQPQPAINADPRADRADEIMQEFNTLNQRLNDDIPPEQRVAIENRIRELGNEAAALRSNTRPEPTPISTPAPLPEPSLDDRATAIMNEYTQLRSRLNSTTNADERALIEARLRELGNQAENLRRPIAEAVNEQLEPVRNARRELDEAIEEQNTAPIVEPEPEAPVAPATTSRGSIDADYMAEIERRRAAYNADQDAAIEAARANTVVSQPEINIPYMREQTGLLLEQYGIDPTGWQGVRLEPMYRILNSEGFKRADNKAGYLRAALRNEAEANARPNPTMAAMNNNITEQRLRAEAGTDTNVPTTQLSDEPRFTGEQIANEVSELGSDQGGISDYLADIIKKEDYRQTTVKIDDLRKSDPDLNEYLENSGGEIREFEGDPFGMDPIVSSTGEVHDGYNRISQALADGRTEIDVLQGVAREAQPAKAQPAEALSIKAEISDDLATAPNLDTKIKTVKSSELELGSDALGDISYSTVASYARSIQAGETIDPIVVSNEAGKLYIQDGKHRFLAAQELGIDDIPVVEQGARNIDPIDALPTPPPEVAGQPNNIKIPKPGQTRAAQLAASDLSGSERVAASEQLGREIFAEADSMLQASGSSYDELAKTIRELNRRQKAGETGLALPEHMKPAYDFIRAELDAAYDYRKQVMPDASGRKTKDFGDQGEFYLPERVAGRLKQDQTASSLFVDGLAEIEDTSELKRTGSIDIDRLDTTENPLVDYMRSMLNLETGETRMAEALVREAAEAGRNIPPANAVEVANKMVDLQGRIDRAARTGKFERTKNAFDKFLGKGFEDNVYKINVAKELNEHGKLLGKERIQVTDVARGFTIGNKVDNLRIGDRTLGELGVRDYYDADAIGKSIMAEALDNRMIETRPLIRELEKFPFLQEKDIENISSFVNNKTDDAIKMIQAEGLTDEVADRLYREMTERTLSRAIKWASKINLAELAQRVEFRSPSAEKTFNEAVTPILVDQRIEQGYIDTILTGVATWTNNALRGYNPKSAATELGDMAEINVAAGTPNVLRAQAEMNLNVPAMIEQMEKYGRMQGLDPKADWARKNQGVLNTMSEAMDKNALTKGLKTIADPMTLVRGVTLYKEAVALRALELKWGNQLQGTDLTRQVLKEYYETVLPATPLNRSVLNNSPLKRVMFQYMNWQVQNVRRTGRFALGRSNVTKVDGNAISGAEFLATAGASKTALWAVQNTLFGTTLGSAFGIFDPIGALSGDFSRIDDEDKTIVDRLVGAAGISPFFSLFENAYFAHRREEIRAEDQASGELLPGQDDTEGYSQDNMLSDLFSSTKNMAFPGALSLFRTGDFLEASNQGFSESRDGRIQYQTPEVGTLDWFRGLFGGKSATTEAREYQDAPDLLRSPFDAFLKDPMIDNFFGTRDYNRPLTNSTYGDDDTNFDQMAREVMAETEAIYGVGSKESRNALKEWIDHGRKYNKVFDKFRKEKPAEFERWQATMDDDIITPEKWGIYRGNPEIFKFMKERKQMENELLGRPIDPIYQDTVTAEIWDKENPGQKKQVTLKVTDEMRNEILQERSMFTGDDMRQRKILYEHEWYNAMKEAERAYYGTFNDDADDVTGGRSARAKEWYELSKMAFDPEEGIEAKYPTLQQMNRINREYGFGSEQSNGFYQAYGDAYRAEKEAYEIERFGIVNRMREIEGAEPLTFEQFTAKVQVGESGSRSGGGSGRGYSRGRGGGGGYTPRENTRNMIGFAQLQSRTAQAPRAARPKQRQSLNINARVGSRPRRRVTIGGRSSGRGASPQI